MIIYVHEIFTHGQGEYKYMREVRERFYECDVCNVYAGDDIAREYIIIIYYVHNSVCACVCTVYTPISTAAMMVMILCSDAHVHM